MLIDWKDIAPPPKLWLFQGNGIFKNGELGRLLCIVSPDPTPKGHELTVRRIPF